MGIRLDLSAQRFTLQALRVLETFNNTLHPPKDECCRNSHIPTRLNCVLNLHDCWARFNKELVFKSALGGYTTSSGQTLNRLSGLQGRNVSALLVNINRRYQHTEPNWAVQSDVTNICNRLGVSNHSNISAAIGSNSSPAEEVRRARNYIAHRNADTAQRALRELASRGATLPIDIDKIITSYTSGGITVFETWVTDLRAVAFTACA